MKKVHLLFTLLIIATTFNTAHAQISHPAFNGAKATLKSYKALYMINNNDEKKIAGTLRNMRNALDDPRLKGKLKLELIAFGDGIAVYDRKGTFEKTLLALKGDGVILAACENTIRERKIDKNTLFDFINFVPSGNGEIIIRQSQGWSVVHP